MAWEIREVTKGWEPRTPVFKFTAGNEVITKMGIEDSDGVLRLFYMKLNNLKGVVECRQFKIRKEKSYESNMAR